MPSFRTAVLVAALATVIGLGAAPATASPVRVATGHTAAGHVHNRAPKPDFRPFCGSHSPSNPRCISLVLAAINRAHRAESVRPMVLPRNYRHLTYARQLFVVTDLERVDRGLRPFRGLVANLNRRAQLGAAHLGDPTVGGALMRLLGLQQWRSVWAEDLGPLAADYDWMYEDGYSTAGPRVTDCNRPHGDGCWAHRRSVLGQYSGRHLYAGAAAAYPYALSVAVVMGAVESGRAHLGFTWRAAVRAGADARRTPNRRN